MVCRKCGKALSNEVPTCPFCGAFLASDQISSFVEMKKEKSRDLRPHLISEKYGMDPIVYERKLNQQNSRLIVILILCGIVAVLFLIVLFIFFT